MRRTPRPSFYGVPLWQPKHPRLVFALVVGWAVFLTIYFTVTGWPFG